MSLSQNAFLPQNIVVIGAGGTGSYFIDLLSRWITSVREFTRGSSPVTTHIVDGDLIETSNLRRQFFFPWEVNKSKAYCLTLRYSKFILANHYPLMINQSNISTFFQPFLTDNLLVICCVDNLESRKLTLEYLTAQYSDPKNHDKSFLWVSPGNTDSRGQVMSYGVVEGKTTYPIPLTTLFTELGNASARGLTATGTGCGISTEGIQTVEMNVLAALTTIRLLSKFFNEGLYCPSVFFTEDSVSWSEMIPLNVEELEEDTLIEDLPPSSVDNNQEISPGRSLFDLDSLNRRIHNPTSSFPVFSSMASSISMEEINRSDVEPEAYQESDEF